MNSALTWPDGTPKSLGNAFSISGSSSIGKTMQRSAITSKNVTDSVNKMRANGKDVSTIPGLSDKSALQERNPKRFTVASKR